MDRRGFFGVLVGAFGAVVLRRRGGSAVDSPRIRITTEGICPYLRRLGADRQIRFASTDEGPTPFFDRWKEHLEAHRRALAEEHRRAITREMFELGAGP